MGLDRAIAHAEPSNVKSPNLLNYSGNIVLSAPNQSSVVPYVTGGIGGLSLFEKAGRGSVQERCPRPSLAQETRFGHRVYGGVIVNIGR